MKRVNIVIAARQEQKNLSELLPTLTWAHQVYVLDSFYDEETCSIVKRHGREYVDFSIVRQGFEKKRSWFLKHFKNSLLGQWILFLDADERLSEGFVKEYLSAIQDKGACALMAKKRLLFMGKEISFGGFDFPVIFSGIIEKISFESVEDSQSGLDMEVHERLVVDGSVGKMTQKILNIESIGLSHYIEKHNRYSTWEANRFFKFGRSGLLIRGDMLPVGIRARRFVRSLVFGSWYEALLFFTYHYFFRLALLHGREGFILCRLRASYYLDIRDKLFELRTVK